LILTSSKRLALATILRDSIEAGRRGADVAAMTIALRDAGKLADVDLTEGPIGTLGDERVRQKRFADGIAIHMLATQLFPKSFRAFGRLGDAQRASGDNASALASYRKALDVNPKSTERRARRRGSDREEIAAP